MLAGMARADAQSRVAANLIIERPDMIELLRQRRRGFEDTGCEAAPDLTGQPRLALRATADHDGVGPRHLQRGYGLLERCDVAVDDERNADRIPDSAHRAPIGLALVELTPRTPVHRNQLHARGLGPARQLPRLERQLVPTEPHL